MLRVIRLTFFLFFIWSISLYSQQEIIKSWEGNIKAGSTELKVIFHITQKEDGTLAASLDSPNQGAKGIPVEKIIYEDGKLKIEVPSINGEYTGKVKEDYSEIYGEWKQAGQRFPLVLTPVDTNTVKKFFSMWQGSLKVGAVDLRIIIKFYKASDHLIGAFLDSPDQGAMDIQASKVHYGEDSVLVEVKSINGYFTGRFNNDKTKIEGDWKQGELSIPLILEKLDKAEEIKRPQEPKRPFPYTEEEVIFKNNEADIILAGTITFPKEGNNFPAVILVSGSGPQNRDEELLGHKPFLVWSDYFTKNGIAVLRFDDRGVGKSTGKFSAATTLDFVTDALAALEYLKTRKEVDHKKIGIIGHSEGGIIAPIAANKSDDVSFIVLVAGPAVSGKEILLLQSKLYSESIGLPEEKINEAERVNKNIYNILIETEDSVEADKQLVNYLEKQDLLLPEEEKSKPENKKIYIDSQRKMLMSPWFRHFLKYDPHDQLEKLKIPVLAIFGEKDLQVSPLQNALEMERALQKSESKNNEVIILPGLNHLLQESETGAPTEYGRIEQTTSPQALKVMTDWILKVTR